MTLMTLFVVKNAASSGASRPVRPAGARRSARRRPQRRANRGSPPKARARRVRGRPPCRRDTRERGETQLSARGGPRPSADPARGRRRGRRASREGRSRDPERDGPAERPGLQRHLVRDGGPRADGGKAVDGAQPEVRHRAPTLEVRIDDESGDRDRPQPPDDRLELVDGDQKDHEGRDRRGDLPGLERAPRQLASRRARVAHRGRHR